MPESTKSTRARRSPADIATEAHDSAKQRVTKAKERQARAEKELESAKAEVTRLQRVADYAAKNPDLPENQGQESDEDTGVDEERSLSIA